MRPSVGGVAGAGGEHTEHEDRPWTRAIPNHPARADSPAYRASRRALSAIVETTPGGFYGDGNHQDHHGGGLWLRDDAGWFLVRNLAGIEWSAQWGADPARVELLRRNAQRLYACFPEAVAALQALVGGSYNVRQVLATPIVDASGVALWTDSIFNASVPLPAAVHTGVLPAAAGAHHYPAPVQEIPYFARADLRVFVADAEGSPWHPGARETAASRWCGRSMDRRCRATSACPTASGGGTSSPPTTRSPVRPSPARRSPSRRRDPRAARR